MPQYYLAIDQGTTGSTAMLANSETLEIVAKVNDEFKQIYPRPSYVEHDLNDIWSSVSNTVTKVIQKAEAKPSQIEAIGITNQRETTCAFNRRGRPLANALVWQDRRTESFCQQLIKQGYQENIKEKTGLPIDAYFSATKMKWLLENHPQVQKAEKEDNLLFGTIETYLLYRMTGNKSFKAEVTNASRTLLMNLQTQKWDEDLLNIFGVRRDQLGTIEDSFGEFGTTRGLEWLPDGIPIRGILGDQQSALVGQAGLSRGNFKCTYGTGSFLLLNTGEQIERSPHGLVSTVAYRHKGKTAYALEGSCYIAGAAVQWLRDNLGLIAHSAGVEELAKEVADLKEMEHVLFLPFFTGLGSPYWISEGKAAILGLTRDTEKKHLARACLEGVAFSICDLIESLRQTVDFSLEGLKVDGGMAANDLFLQIQADAAAISIIRPANLETTAAGAIYAAALGSERLTAEHITKLWTQERQFHPAPQGRDYFAGKYQNWKKAIEKLY